MPYRISRLGTVEIRSLDLDRDLDYYLNVLGLQLTAREGRTAYLKGWDERHAYSVMLTESDRAGMVRLAFRTVDPEDLDIIAAAHAYRVERRAQRALRRGHFAQATRHLRDTRQIVERLGRPELAAELEAQAAAVEAGTRLSAEREKRIKAATRRLMG